MFSDQVKMIGLDFGSTTSSAMVATAGVGLNSTTGRMEFGSPRVLYRSEPIFTPFDSEKIDSDRIDGYISEWIADSGVPLADFFAGGAIITGLAAKHNNATELVDLIGRRIGEAVVATADDPCLESWLAFMGSCSNLSKFHAEKPFLNIDIGGGTTNPALGINGNVLQTGCHFVGARHFQFEPGTYLLSGISSFGRALVEHLGIDKKIGMEIESLEIEAILDFYIAVLEAIARGNTRIFESSTERLHQQVPFTFGVMKTEPVLVYSGGVGELIYKYAQGQKLPATTYYGDLGIDLAKRIVQSPTLAAHITDWVPENHGRATVYGLALHSTEISGSTIFLSDQNILPCRDLPIVARLPIHASAQQVHDALTLVSASSSGGCIQVLSEESPEEGTAAAAVESLDKVKTFSRRLRAACVGVNPEKPLVVLTPHNYGQVLGNYTSNWRQEVFDLIVIDEIPDRHAHFVNIGRLHGNIVPASFYGVC